MADKCRGITKTNSPCNRKVTPTGENGGFCHQHQDQRPSATPAAAARSPASALDPPPTLISPTYTSDTDSGPSGAGPSRSQPTRPPASGAGPSSCTPGVGRGPVQSDSDDESGPPGGRRPDPPRRSGAAASQASGTGASPLPVRNLERALDDTASSGQSTLAVALASAGLVPRLYPHQERGVGWMRAQEGSIGGGIMADDMGMGKTVQLLALLLLERAGPGGLRRTGVGPTLVVAPITVFDTWRGQPARHVRPEQALRVHVFHETGKGLSALELAEFDIVVTNYHTFQPKAKGAAALLAVCWSRVVLDEAQNIKNRAFGFEDAICRLQSDFRWCLTGTPVENKLEDMLPLCEFVRFSPAPNLGAWFTDLTQAAAKSQLDRPGAKETVQRLLGAVMIRRTKLGQAARGHRGLPTCFVADVEIPLSDEEQAIYDKCVSGTLEAVQAKNGLVKLMRLRQLAAGLDGVRKSMGAAIMEELKDEDAEQTMDWKSRYNVGIKLGAAIDVVKQLLDGAAGSDGYKSTFRQRTTDGLGPPVEKHIKGAAGVGNRVVIFSSFRTVINALEDALREELKMVNNRDYIVIAGDVTGERREAALLKFDSEADGPGPRVALCTLQAGGCGINLQRANCVILLDPYFNPSKEWQAQDRVWRIGSPHAECFMINFAVKGSVEDGQIREIKIRKEKIIEHSVFLLNDLDANDQAYAGGGAGRGAAQAIAAPTPARAAAPAVTASVPPAAKPSAAPASSAVPPPPPARVGRGPEPILPANVRTKKDGTPDERFKEFKDWKKAHDAWAALG